MFCCHDKTNKQPIWPSFNKHAVTLSQIFIFSYLTKMTMLPPDPLFVIRSNESVMAVSFGPDNNSLFSGNLQGVVKEWSLKSFRVTSTFSAGSESILAINCVTTKNQIIVQNKMGMLSLWESLEKQWSQIWAVNVDYMGFCQFRVFNETVISALASAGLEFFSMAGETLNRVDLWGREKSGDIMAIYPYERDEQDFLIVAAERGDVGVWSWDGTPQGDCLRLEEAAMVLCFDVARMRGAAGGPTGSVTIFNVAPKGVIVNRVIDFPKTGIGALELRPDQRVLAVGCWNGTLKLFSWKSLTLLAVLPSHDHSLQSIKFTENPPYLFAAACKDGRISIWNLYN